MKKILAGLLAALMLLGLGSAAAFAAEPLGYVAVSVDADVLGAGILYGPELIPFYAGESYADVTQRFLGDNCEVDTDWGFYLTGIKLPRDFTLDVPSVLADKTGELDAGHSKAGEILQGFDFTATSGWFYTVNNEDMGAGADTVPAEDGGVLRWQFSLINWGADLGLAWDGNNVFTPEDKTALIAAVAKINSSSEKAALLGDPAVKAAYDEAYIILADLAASKSAVGATLAILNSAVANVGKTPSFLERWHAKLPDWMGGVVHLWDIWQYVILFTVGWIWFLF